MPDGRFLSKTIAHDWELNQVSMGADYLFSRCVPHLDVEGRMPGHPGQVKAIAVPLRDDMGPMEVDRALGELASASLIRWYEHDGRPWLEFPGFERHQKGLRKDREAPSPIPPAKHPDSSPIRTVFGVTPENSGPTPENSRDDAARMPRDGRATPAKLSEVKPSEVKATSTSGARESSPDVSESTIEMLEQLDAHLRTLDGMEAQKLEAHARMVALGEDPKAWEIDDGTKVPPPERPALFRMALGFHADGTQKAFRSSVRYAVKLYTADDPTPVDPTMTAADRRLIESVNSLRDVDLGAAIQ